MMLKMMMMMMMMMMMVMVMVMMMMMMTTGAHNPERATSMRSCHGVFTDQFIFRTTLV